MRMAPAALVQANQGDDSRLENAGLPNGVPVLSRFDESPLQIILKQKWRILSFSCVISIFAGVIIWNIPPVYTANASVAIDPRQIKILSQDQLLASQRVDEPQLRTYMEEFGSPSLARLVVANLSLDKNPAYCDKEVPLWNLQSWRELLFHKSGQSLAAPAACSTSFDKAVETLLKNVSATNDGKSYVIHISAAAPDAKLAAAIANEYAAAYVADNIAKKKKVIDEASSWLHTYVDQLSGQVAEADTAVAKYRTEHNLVSVKGETLDSQSLMELNSQITSLNNEIAKKQSLLSQLGPSWEGSLSKEVAALNERKMLMTSQLHEYQAHVSQQGDEDVGLQGLLHKAESSRQIYEAALTRIREIEIDAGISRSDAQVVSEALVPHYPSYPLKSMMLAGAFFSSLGLGAALAVGMSAGSRIIRDETQLEQETGLRLLGVFPSPRSKRSAATIVLDEPLSLEAECLYKVLAELLDLRPKQKSEPGKTILLTSANPGEGKSSYSLALAFSARQIGLSAIIVDCDLWQPAVVNMLRGLELQPVSLSYLDTAQPRSFDEYAFAKDLLIEPKTGLNILPLAPEMSDSPYLVFSGAVMKQMLNLLRWKYDLVILDSPPLMARKDALPLASLADDVILLVSHRRTPRDTVLKVIDMLRRQGAPGPNVIFSKANLRKYEWANSGYNYSARYSSKQRNKDATR